MIIEPENPQRLVSLSDMRVTTGAYINSNHWRRSTVLDWSPSICTSQLAIMTQLGGNTGT